VFVHPSVSVVDGQDVNEYDDVDELIWVDMSDMGVVMGVDMWLGKVSCN
jgi:uncharacterized protein YuzE